MINHIEELKIGLTSTPKHINRKFSCDKRGDEIFEELMNCSTYYVPRSELEIFKIHKTKMLNLFTQQESSFNLIDLGVGSGVKSRILIEELLSKEIDFTFYPLDISQNAVQNVTQNLVHDFPDLKVVPIVADFFEGIKEINSLTQNRNVYLFLGGSSGNIFAKERVKFYSQLAKQLSKDDLFLTGFDLIKKPSVILDAYANGNSKIVSELFVNALQRMNQELNANFDVSKFKFHFHYNPRNGRGNFDFVCTEKMQVEIQKMNMALNLDKFEVINLGLSDKFSLNQIENLATQTGFEIVENLFDTKEYFVNSVWRKRESITNYKLLMC